MKIFRIQIRAYGYAADFKIGYRTAFLHEKGKSKVVKGKKSNKPGYKKAIVTLKKGQSIDLSTGI